MIKRLFFSGITLIALAANGQQTIYLANDLNSFGNWTFIDGDTDGNNWAIEDQSTTQGLDLQGDLLTSFSLNPSNFNPLTPDNFALSTPINCSNHENLSLKFKRTSAGAPGAEAESYSVYAINAASQAALLASLSSATPLYTETITVGKELVLRTIDLSSLDGMSDLYIVFRHHNCTGQFFLAIDDVVLEGSMTSASIINLSLDMSIYPQPMSGNLTISMEENIKNLLLINQIGEIVFQENGINSKSFIVNTENLSNGLYFLKVTDESGSVYTKKCVK